MEKDSRIKRGIDFATRVGSSAKPLRRAFAWWKGERLNKNTLLFLTIIWLLNLIIIYPVFGKDLTPAYTPSSIIILLSEFANRFLLINHYYFFLILTFLSLTFAPLGFYLFVRRIAMRHEITALIATLLFILPYPFLGNMPVLVSALLNGDGAHILAIAFIPFFLLYLQAFLSSGAPILFFLSSLGIAYIALISPFSAFNFLIIFSIILLAEGFQGDLRIKIIRAIVLIIMACALSFFWYYPSKLINFFSLHYVQFTFAKFLGIAPAAIPVIPVAGALAFLIFDRRTKLKPIFISLSLFIVYVTIFVISMQLGINGILSSVRYLPEVFLSASLMLSIILIFLIQLFIKTVLSEIKEKLKFVGLLTLISIVVAFFSFLIIQSIAIAHTSIQSARIVDNYNAGEVTIKNLIKLSDTSFIFAAAISFSTLVFLIFIIRKYPMVLKRQT